jgi:hypothetical protein
VLLLNVVVSVLLPTVIDESLITVVAKVDTVEICTRYVVAPLTVPHVNVGMVGILVAPLLGELNTGESGAVDTLLLFELVGLQLSKNASNKTLIKSNTLRFMVLSLVFD